MTPFERTTGQLAEAGRWTARILGTLMVLFLLALVFGEGPPPVWRMNPREQLYWVGIVCLFGGLVLAWLREGWGGLVTLLGWIFLGVLTGKPLWDLQFSLAGAMGLLHLLCWLRLRDRPTTAPTSILQYVGAAVVVFVLLCANEIFGMPPLMTPSGPLPANLAGAWAQDAPVAVSWTVGPTGAISGSIDGQPLMQAHLSGNRSWFGRLMHWRTDYIAEGWTADKVHFLAPCAVEQAQLDGSLVLTNGTAVPYQLHLVRR